MLISREKERATEARSDAAHKHAVHSADRSILLTPTASAYSVTSTESCQATRSPGEGQGFGDDRNALHLISAF